MVHGALCNVRVTSTAAPQQAVKANLIISFLFFTFVPKQSRQMQRWLMHEHTKIENEFTFRGSDSHDRSRQTFTSN